MTHRDDQGNSGETRAGDVQVMSAGTGIRHSEQNEGDTPIRLFQIWPLLYLIGYGRGNASS